MAIQPNGGRILVVEDEESISQPFAEALRRAGFEAIVTATAAGALELAASAEPDLVMLDLALPDGDGRDVCRELRRHSEVPIMMLTARGTEMDKIVGLELGADDYVVKPFSAAEVISRIRAVLRRSSRGGEAPAKPIEIAGVELDPGARIAKMNGQRAGALAQGVRPAGGADAPRRAGRQARGPDGGGLGHELVRLDEDARRPRRLAAAQARRRPGRPDLHRDGARRRLPLRRPGGRGTVSLRATLLLALAYVLLLALIALGVPLALSLRDRVDSEVKSQAAQPGAGRRDDGVGGDLPAGIPHPRQARPASRPQACAAG